MRLQGFRGNCSTLAGKSRGGTPFCRTLKTVFPKRSCSWKTNRIRFGRIASLSASVLFAGVALSELPMNVS